MTKNNVLRVFCAFAGYDSQCLALDRLKRDYPEFDYELIGWSEVDKYAIQAHNALYPQWADRNFGDITKIDWDQVPDFDLFTYSSPCFVAGTKVLTKLGYKSIEDIRIGDEAFTHNHTFKSITAIGSDGEKPIWQIKPMGAFAISCTKNHPFLIRRRLRKWDNATRRWEYVFTDPYKSKIEDFIGGEYVGIPILPTIYHTEYNDEILWLVGRYIADGHLRDNELIISVGKDKLSQFYNISIPHRVHKNSNSCYRVVFSRSTPIYSAVKELTNCGKAINKAFDTKCLFFDKECVRVILEGYMSGDGCYIEKTHSHQATTISKDLANQLVLMAQKVYGVGAKVYETKRPKKHIIQGREVNQHDTYTIRYQLHNDKKSWFNDGRFIWYPIKSVENTHQVEVIYNITVEDDHTYTANNITCFNCQDFSNAGLQRGGEEGSGTRSSLLWECRRAIVAKRPKYCLLENVKALVSKKFMPLFNKWQDELAEYGYANFWQVLNAKNYGVPQNRERVFLWSILRTEADPRPEYHFPRPFPLELRLKDVLEESVDEKYYLSDKNVDNLRWVTAKENCRNPLTLKHSSEARKGEKHYFYGKHHTKETRKKCSKSHLGHEVTEETRRKIGLSNKGKVRSDEVKKDISNRMKEWHKTHKSHNMRQVTQCDTNRNVIKVWESLTTASKGTGVSVASISNNIKGRSKSAGGFIWV